MRRGVRAHPGPPARAVRPGVLAGRPLPADAARSATRLAARLGGPLVRGGRAHRPDVVVSTYPASTRCSPPRAPRPPRRAGRVGDHRPRGAALLGPPRLRPPPRHPSGVGGGDPRDRGRRRADRARARPHLARLRDPRGRRRGARRRSACPRTRRSWRSRAAAGRSATCSGAASAALDAGAGVHVVALCGRNEGVRRRLERAFARAVAGARARLHGPHGRRARRRRRARPLHGRADRAGGAGPRHARHLLRLGRRPHPPQQPRLRRFGLAEVVARPPARSCPRSAARSARRGGPTPATAACRPPRTWCCGWRMAAAGMMRGRDARFTTARRPRPLRDRLRPARPRAPARRCGTR